MKTCAMCHRVAKSILPWLVAASVSLSAGTSRSAAEDAWTGSWVSAQQLTEPHNMPPAPGIAHATLRQVLFPTLSGDQLRVTFSNVFGNAPLPLVLDAVHIAVAAPGGSIVPGTDHIATFNGRTGVVIEPGASMITDPVAMRVEAMRELAVSIEIGSAPSHITGHPGSRETSYFCPGTFASAEHLPSPERAEHWYFLASLDVWRSTPASDIVVLGDSITDGHASTTNANNRWPDDLVRRLQADPAKADIGVLNQGIGGNRLLRDGLGPNALARFDRDVLAPPGVRWLIVFEGINDIGTRLGAQKHGWPYAGADDIIAAYQQIIERAHDHGLKVFGATITPYKGCGFYYSEDGEAVREAVNRWIRAKGHFDAVIDFDQMVRDPQHPLRLAPAYDSGDHLHPSVAGYQHMAEAVDLGLFQ